MSRPVLLRAALAALVALVVAVAVVIGVRTWGTSASPEERADGRHMTSDPAGDVVAVRAVADGPRDVTPAPDVREVDVTGVSYRYDRDRLTVTAQARGVARGVQLLLDVLVGDRAYGFSGYPDPRERVLVSDGLALLARCDDAELTLDADTSRYRFVVPARCFGSPAEMRVALETNRDLNGTNVTQSDDANADEPVDSGTPTTPVTLTPPIRRG